MQGTAGNTQTQPPQPRFPRASRDLALHLRALQTRALKPNPLPRVSPPHFPQAQDTVARVMGRLCSLLSMQETPLGSHPSPESQLCTLPYTSQPHHGSHRAVWGQLSSDKRSCDWDPTALRRERLFAKGLAPSRPQSGPARMCGIAILLVPESVHDSAGLTGGTGPVGRGVPRVRTRFAGCSQSQKGLGWDVCSHCPCPSEERGSILWDCQSGTFHQS